MHLPAMADDCIVIADESSDESDDSLPPFNQISSGFGKTTTLQIKRAFPGQQGTSNKKSARTRDTPEVVYDLTSSPNVSSTASSPSSNAVHAEEQPMSSISVGSRTGTEASNSEMPLLSFLTGRTHGSCSKDIIADSDATSDVDSENNAAANIDSDPPVTVNAKEAEKKKRAMERAAVKKQKQQQKKIDQAKKKAAKEAQKELTKDERVKQLIVLLDVSLSENPSFIAELSTQLKDLGVTYRVSSMEPPGSVRWKRKVTSRIVDDNAQVICNVREEDLPHLLLTLEGTGFLSLVHYSKQELACGDSTPNEGKTLVQFVSEMQNKYPEVKLTVALEGLQSSLRSQKTQKNRQFRATVRQKQMATNLNLITPLSGITKVDCQEALVSLQLTTGCCVRMCEEPVDLAGLVVTYTKALAELPFIKEYPFEFYASLGPGMSKEVMLDSDDQLALTWQHQLMQFPSVSTPIATAIAARYPSPASLMTAYESCENTKDAALLLQDIQVRRGVGVTSSTRRVGPVTSKRIHRMLTSKEENLALN